MGSAVHSRIVDAVVKHDIEPLTKEHRSLVNKMLKNGINAQDMDRLNKIVGEMIEVAKQLRAELGCQNLSIPLSS